MKTLSRTSNSLANPTRNATINTNNCYFDHSVLFSENGMKYHHSVLLVMIDLNGFIFQNSR